ncbi:MAG: hypothetical protein H6492_02745 [Candidatus Paracaedibacteraceae bacterium]|nr:hypothetical protein [Candidatus Paracaedibacteraceae bacterium]
MPRNIYKLSIFLFLLISRIHSASTAEIPQSRGCGVPTVRQSSLVEEITPAKYKETFPENTERTFQIICHLPSDWLAGVFRLSIDENGSIQWSITESEFRTESRDGIEINNIYFEPSDKIDFFGSGVRRTFDKDRQLFKYSIDFNNINAKISSISTHSSSSCFSLCVEDNGDYYADEEVPLCMRRFGTLPINSVMSFHTMQDVTVEINVNNFLAPPNVVLRKK